MTSAAERLDAADGVIDGKYYGRRIVEASPGRPLSSAAYNLDAADGVIDGRYHGRRIVEAPARPSYASAAPAIYTGSYATPTFYEGGAAYAGAAYAAPAPYTPVRQAYSAGYTTGSYGTGYGSGYGTGYTTGYGGGYYATPRTYGSTAHDLDAADGVIDGKYYGRQIVEAAPASYAPARYTPPAGYSYAGTTAGYAPSAGFASAAAYNLDAADGVIDGKFHGRRIVEAPTARPAYYPAYSGNSYYSDAYPAAAGRYVESRPTYDASYVRSGAPVRRYSQGADFGYADGYYSARPAQYASGYYPAERYYGDAVVDRPYTRTGYTAAPRYAAEYYGPRYSSGRTTPSAAAQQLDAADGVIDGKYYGSRIVDAGH